MQYVSKYNFVKLIYVVVLDFTRFFLPSSSGSSADPYPVRLAKPLPDNSSFFVNTILKAKSSVFCFWIWTSGGCCGTYKIKKSQIDLTGKKSFDGKEVKVVKEKLILNPHAFGR